MFRAEISTKTKLVKPELPHIFRDRQGRRIALFYREECGVVIGGQDCLFGEHCTAFVSCWDSEVWTPLAPGESITLTAE